MAFPNSPAPLCGRSAPEQWVALPRDLLQRLSAFRSLAELKVVLYVLTHTYGYREYAAMKAITLDEFAHGRKRADGTRMDEGTGLSRAAIKLGLKQAKEDAFLYEVVDEHDQARIVRWYAVQLPSDCSASRIDSSPLAQPYDAPEPTNSSVGGIASSHLTQPYAAEMPPHGSVSGLAARSRSEKETVERNQQKKSLEKEAGSDMLAVSEEVDSLAQCLADQQVLQRLLAERDSLQRLSPGQSGWGAAQRRLRALAPEIARLQTACASQAAESSSAEPEEFSSEVGTPAGSKSALEDQPPTPISGPSAPANEEAADRAARRQRLLALQQELAQIKRTPSMQLLARQRIPRLEAAIRQLIASFEETA
jgi:hypothetical protein